MMLGRACASRKGQSAIVRHMGRRISEAQIAYAKTLAKSGRYRSVREVAAKAKMSERSARKYGVEIPASSLSYDPLATSLGIGSPLNWRQGAEARLGEDLRGIDFWHIQLGGSDYHRATTGESAAPGRVSDETVKSMEAAMEREANLITMRRQAGLPVSADLKDCSELDDLDCRWASLWLNATALPYTPSDISRLARERRQRVYGDQGAPYPAKDAVQRVVVHIVMAEAAVDDWCNRYSRQVVPVPTEVLNAAYAAAEDAIADVGLRG